MLNPAPMKGQARGAKAEDAGQMLCAGQRCFARTGRRSWQTVAYVEDLRQRGKSGEMHTSDRGTGPQLR